MTDVRIDVDLTSPVTLVWRAVTERHLLGEWFMPTDLLPVAGAVYRAFPPAGLPGLRAVFDIDVVEVVAQQRLCMMWRTEQLHTEVVWELAEAPGGCRLSVRQSGFFGLSGGERRAELLESYETLFRQRLPRLPQMQASSVAIMAGELTATYRTKEKYALGHIGSITVRAGSRAVPRWTATIELPRPDAMSTICQAK